MKGRTLVFFGLQDESVQLDQVLAASSLQLLTKPGPVPMAEDSLVSAKHYAAPFCAGFRSRLKTW